MILTDITKSYHPRLDDYNTIDTNYRFNFKTYKVLDQDEELLAANNNITALFMLTVLYGIRHEISKNDNQLLEDKIKLLKNLKSRDLGPAEQSKVLTIIQLYTNFFDNKMTIKFEELITLIIGKTENMGIIEYAIHEAEERGIEQGIEQKSISVVTNLLQNTQHTVAQIAGFVSVPETFVRSVKMKLGL